MSQKHIRNQLNNATQYALMRFLDTNDMKARMLVEEDSDIAQAASAKLKVTITGLNIASARRILGVRKHTTATKVNGADLKDLIATVERLEERLTSLEKSLGVKV